jgi:hypothetical protein
VNSFALSPGAPSGACFLPTDRNQNILVLSYKIGSGLLADWRFDTLFLAGGNAL